VVTLIPSRDNICHGVAYLVERRVFEHLDHREKNGYERQRVTIAIGAGKIPIEGLTYVAASNNPAYLGPAPLRELAGHISKTSGPSGSNRDYLLQLATALRELKASDPHIYALEALVRKETVT
jgi:glutathione-specific gamma-glutamylcyclotransferase